MQQDGRFSGGRTRPERVSVPGEAPEIRPCRRRVEPQEARPQKVHLLGKLAFQCGRGAGALFLRQGRVGRREVHQGSAHRAGSWK